jgi:hypothetical protein
MKFNTGTIISFTLLLLALLINIWRYPQVQEMLGRELQANLIPPVLSYKLKLDNSIQSDQSDQLDLSDESDQSDQSDKSDKINPSVESGITQNHSPIGAALTERTQINADNPTTSNSIQPTTKPQKQNSITATPENNKKNESELPPPTNPTTSTTPKNTTSQTQQNTTKPKTENLLQQKILPEESPTHELLPETNLLDKLPAQDISLQNIPTNRNLIDASWYETNSNYVIYSPAPVAAIVATPQPTYANNYTIKNTEQNNTINKNKQQITKIISQQKNEIKHNRLINTIDTTLERPIIYD